nr:transglycosylase SLT domain-containing protein [Piscinibacter defluvii]
MTRPTAVRVRACLAALAIFLAGCATAPTTGDTPVGPVAAEAVPVVPDPPAAPVPLAEPAAESARAPAPVDPLRPEVPLDLDDRSARVDLWERVRGGLRIPTLDNELVRQWERWYADRPDYVQRMTERGGRYLFHIVEELDKRGMPADLALLPFVESAFNPQAMSSARASGMWQFMPATGRSFELRQNMFRDDRRDVLASTRAALDYLQKLHGMFDDWQLALAAYNWGEGNVGRAIERNRRAGLPTDYDSLRMPAETRNYVPKLQAIKNIVLAPADYGLELPELANHPYFLAVPIERDIDVALAATLAELPLDEFKALNPQMNKPVILAAGTPQVLLPYDNANTFVRRLPQHRGPLASWTAWVAPRTLSTAAAAKLVGMDEATLREVNRIPPRMLVRAGSALLVPRSEQRHADVPEHLAEHAQIAFAPAEPAKRRLVLKAGKRDSVASVARRYRVAPAQVAQWNDVAVGSRFRAGEQVVVWVAAKPAKKVAAGRPAARKTASVKRTARGSNTRVAASAR